MSNFKVIHSKLQKRSEIYSKTAKLWKSGAALKSLGKIIWEIKLIDTVFPHTKSTITEF